MAVGALGALGNGMAGDFAVRDQPASLRRGSGPQSLPSTAQDALFLSAEAREKAAREAETQTTAEDDPQAVAPDLEQLSEEEQKEVDRLAQRDREVRQHEQAHIAAGGQYVQGAAQYTYTRGPNGRQYATGGEVSIDTSKESTPEATIQKARAIRRAALAPAQPSAQDRQVAAEASRLELEARQELAAQGQREARERRGGGFSAGEKRAYAETSGESVPESPRLNVMA